MGDVLSQNEIDDLLKALTTGELNINEMQTTTEEVKVKQYDFTRPNKFSKEHIRMLNVINESYSRILGNYLSAYLRTLVQVEILSIEALSYNEFNNSISNHVVLAIAELSPLKGSVIMEVSADVGFAIIDRILGGQGEKLERIRSFTEIELSIMEKVIVQMLNLLIDPWENVIKLKPRLEKLETNAQFAQIVSPNETIALITFSVKIGELNGLINICIPHLVIEPIMNRLNTKFWFTTSSDNKEDTETMKHHLEYNLSKVYVPLTAILGRSQVSVKDFLNLSVGDVIKLDTKAGAQIEVYTGKINKFKALIGKRNKKTCLKIVSINREEDN